MCGRSWKEHLWPAEAYLRRSCPRRIRRDPEGLHRLTAGCGDLLEPPQLGKTLFLKQAVTGFDFHQKQGHVYTAEHLKNIKKHRQAKTKKYNTFYQLYSWASIDGHFHPSLATCRKGLSMCPSQFGCDALEEQTHLLHPPGTLNVHVTWVLFSTGGHESGHQPTTVVNDSMHDRL